MTDTDMPPPSRQGPCASFHSGSCQDGERCKFPHISQAQATPNPIGIGTQSTSQPQKPNSLGFGTQNTSQPQNPNLLGFGTQDASKPQNPNLLGLATHDASKPQNPNPLELGAQDASKPQNPNPLGLATQDASKPQNPNMLGLATQDTSKPQNPNPLGFATQDASKPQNPNLLGLATQDASKPQNPNLLGLATQDASKPRNPNPLGFGTQDASKPQNPNPRGFGTQDASQPQNPNPLAFGTQDASQPQNPNPLGVGTQDASQPQNPNPLGFGIQDASQLKNPKPTPDTSQPQNPNPLGFGKQNTSQPHNPNQLGFSKQDTSQPQNPNQLGFSMQNTSQPPKSNPFGFGVQNSSQPQKPNPFGFGGQNTFQPQTPKLFGFGVQSAFQPQMPKVFGFGVQNAFQPQIPFGFGVQNNPETKQVKVDQSNENTWSQFSPVSGGNAPALQKQDNQSSATNHVSMETVTTMQGLTSNPGQQGAENQSSQSHDCINIEAEKNVNETNDQHVDKDASVKEEKAQDINAETEVVLKRKRQKSSTVWDDYIVLTYSDGTEKVECIHCKKQLTESANGTTSTYKEHVQSCLKCKQFMRMQQPRNFQPARLEIGWNKPLPLTETGCDMPPRLTGPDVKYDANKMRESIANWLMATEQPFTAVEDEMFIHMLKVANPMFERLSRDTIKSDCFKVYEQEKEKLKALINDASNISLAIDFWKSPHQKVDQQRVDYVAITGHFIDQNWRLQKRVLSVVSVSPPHNGLEIAIAIIKCLNDWGIERKIFSISVDDASYSDKAVRTLKTKISTVKKLPCGGRLFHVRCYAHILNLLARDGLSKINYIIDKVREAVKYINYSEARHRLFSNVAHTLQVPDRKLLIDIPTRWNSTYDMLSLAIKFKDVFPRYARCEPQFKYLPSKNEWDNVQSVCDVLKVLKVCTNIISGTSYPTASLYLLEVYKVKETLDQGALSENAFTRTMNGRMKEKFDKYWKECHLLMAMAAVLDPRLKKWVLDFCYPKIYPQNEALVNIQEVMGTLKQMYEEYLRLYGAPTKESASLRVESSEESTSSANEDSGWHAFGEYLKNANVDRSEKSELQMYLEEGVVQGHGGMGFNVLDWWNTHKHKYRILSKMAIDILAIPFSTVASDSMFSTEERIIDPYHSTLAPTTIEMLVCGGDWVRQLYGVKKRLKKDDTPNAGLLRGLLGKKRRR